MRKIIWLLPLFLLLVLPSFGQAASTIIVTSPTNTTYTSNPITISATTNATNPLWYYSLDGGANVSFVPGGTLSFTNGVHLFRVIVNDSSGHFNSTLIQFTMDSSSFASPGEGSGLGGIVLPFMFGIFVIAIILISMTYLQGSFAGMKINSKSDFFAVIAGIVFGIVAVVVVLLLFGSTITP